ncbi:hypothetical protein [Burkholderia ubonensis]|uniref:hypothetical protein n=1 Tax=Burkholderia ubonensis TaxID=101571 RepID=UPI000755CB01|nr:hypothetical protein [Burkholderia ubonensis]KVS41118.1 hypothetical protein WK38_31675 [Burkholderia ubonensis]KVS45866.1 hypothetical protein WK37_12780 [Burkholderia ubonensis]KVS79740.1 hypothetical protein WK42_14485 [Burkholderia ubonensis]KVS87409.1 hypothetical protein WK44_00160 [Burkholderia ubonensis]KVS94652.1 hypothetical protein WK43_09360 [Burkholderia ubonensis]
MSHIDRSTPENRIKIKGTPDCAEYLDQFLRDPQPAARWIGRGRVERFDPAWRPVVGSLSERSRDTARRILNAMGTWLVGQQYLRVNPFAGLPAAPSVPLDATGRMLPTSAFHAATESTAAAIARDAFGPLFAYATGLRRAELVAATTAELTRTALNGALDDARSVRVQSKGRRARRADAAAPGRRAADEKRGLS